MLGVPGAVARVTAATFRELIGMRRRLIEGLRSRVKGATVEREIEKTDQEWAEELSPEQYEVLRKAGTERAFTGKYWDCHDDGVYRCAACGADLFDASTKFESGTGWPSFTEPMVAEAVETITDRSHGMTRSEVVCKRCGGHLGHVFDDGPGANGLRYCMNSLSLDLAPR